MSKWVDSRILIATIEDGAGEGGFFIEFFVCVRIETVLVEVVPVEVSIEGFVVRQI